MIKNINIFFLFVPHFQNEHEKLDWIMIHFQSWTRAQA